MTRSDEITMELGRPWAFDGRVVDVFDDMLARSIPQYEVMREATSTLAARYWRPGGVVLDLGCSRGEALAQADRAIFALRHDVARSAPPRLVGVEVSKPMLAAARARFEGHDRVSILELDLRKAYPLLPGGRRAAVTLAVLTLQFVPLEYRAHVLRRAYLATEPGGALLVVEKVLGRTSEIDATFVDTYLARKRANGYSEEQIARKRLALEGVLVPLTNAQNEDALRVAGFAHVDTYWRWMNFAGYLALRDEARDA
jgi:tRNA (cmo5U34)-methyltransferase